MAGGLHVLQRVSVRVKGCLSDKGWGLNSFILRKRGEEKGVRLVIEAWRIGRDEAGEIDCNCGWDYNLKLISSSIGQVRLPH